MNCVQTGDILLRHFGNALGASQGVRSIDNSRSYVIVLSPTLLQHRLVEHLRSVVRIVANCRIVKKKQKSERLLHRNQNQFQGYGGRRRNSRCSVVWRPGCPCTKPTCAGGLGRWPSFFLQQPSFLRLSVASVLAGRVSSCHFVFLLKRVPTMLRRKYIDEIG